MGVNCSVPSSICAYAVVFFDFEINGGTPDRLCAVPSTQTCDMEPVGAMNCSCIQNVSGVKVYKLNFLGERAKYEGGKLTCSVDCSPAGQSCEPLRYSEFNVQKLIKVNSFGLFIIHTNDSNIANLSEIAKYIFIFKMKS